MAFDDVSRADLLDLMRRSGAPKVSVYMPTAKAGPETRENPIRLKNLLRAAEGELVATGMRSTSAKDLLRPGYEIEEVQEFRADLGDGLALFFDDEGMRRYRLPVDVPELVVVADRFNVKPLLGMLSGAQAFYVLALSMNEVRAFRAQRFSVRELRIDGMPRSMADALWPDDAEKQLQFKTTNTGISGRGTAIFHSSGDQASDRLKEDIARYFKMVDAAFTRAVGDESTPLVLAGVDYLHPIYRQVSDYANLLEEGVEGNPERARPEELADLARPIAEGYYREALELDAGRFGDLTGTGRASTSLPEIVEAARQGRVDTLWAASGTERWGSVTEEGRAIVHEEQEAGDDDLLDLTAFETLSNSGKVYVVERSEIPNGEPIAAIFRY